MAKSSAVRMVVHRPASRSSGEVGGGVKAAGDGGSGARDGAGGCGAGDGGGGG